MSLKDRVQQRLDELGLSPRAVSIRGGFAPTFVRDLLEGRKKNVRSDSLERLARALETTVKEVRFADKGWLLKAHSTDPAFAEPILLQDEGDDSPEIIGVVIGSYRYETRPPAVYRR